MGYDIAADASWVSVGITGPRPTPNIARQCEGVVVRQRHDTGTEPEVLGPFGRRGDEDLGAGDQLVAAGVMFTEPCFVETQPIQGDHPVHVVFECRRG